MTKWHKFTIGWITFLLVFYLVRILGRTYYRPFLVYCTHWDDSLGFQEYLRDLVIPTGNYLISISILYMYYHQTLLLRQMQKKMAASAEVDRTSEDLAFQRDASAKSGQIMVRGY